MKQHRFHPHQGAAWLLSGLVLAGVLSGCNGPSQQRAPAPVWQADLGDGYYQNPIIHADYSDPDAIRVGERYYMTASSFNSAPGLPLLESADMINWTLVGHALPQQLPAAVFARPQHGKGVWAPCLRYHAGQFWIFYPDPDFGIYVITAKDFRGPWSQPRLLLAGQGLIDPTPLWDEDGQAYLLHAWAKSRAGINNRLTLRRMAPDASRILDQEGKIVIDGDKIPGYSTLEGPKFYKRDGYYYVFAPAGGVEFGWQSVFRAKQIQGPYEDKIVLAQGASPINGPHQGAWVQTPAGDDWFFHFQDKGAYGRIVHLQPMAWKDGWPVMGHNYNREGVGEPVLRQRKPIAGQFAMATPATSDDFNGARLGLQWQWNANWQADWYSLTANPGRLRLFSRYDAEISATRLWYNPALLLQKFPAETFSVTSQLRLKANTEGERAGLVVYGFNYAWLGLQQHQGRAELRLNTCLDTQANCEEQTLFRQTLPQNQVWLRAQVHKGAKVSFAYSLNGVDFIPVAGDFTAQRGRWVGAKIGLFAASELPGGGYADIDNFTLAP